jgi:hypothetical protein
MNYETKQVDILDIKVGDTILHDGQMKTVGRENIKSGFMGRTLFGDSYNLGYKKVTFVMITRYTH